jgi:hypothetical protein
MDKIGRPAHGCPKHGTEVERAIANDVRWTESVVLPPDLGRSIMPDIQPYPGRSGCRGGADIPAVEAIAI